MSTDPAAAGIKTSEDEKTLHRLSYAQELFRAMGGFQNFAISLRSSRSWRDASSHVMRTAREARWP